jgi:hypothetical protein
MRSIGVRAAGLLDTYHAQECSKLLYAFGKSRVQCAEFEDAATAQRTLSFDFLQPVHLNQILNYHPLDSTAFSRKISTKS